MTIREDVEVAFQASGLGAMSSALSGVTGVVQNLLSVVNPLNLALGSLGGGLTLAGISSVGSEYENLRIQMAQTMRFMGRGGASFGDALVSADNTIQQIYTAAAALPGEAEDYALALRMAGADVNRAVGDYQQSFDLIKNMTAVGVSMSRSSAETAMILTNALNTQRGMLEQGSDYTRDLVNSMRNIPQYANITVQSFNAMRLEDRVRIMQQLVGQYGDMIAASSSTMEAVGGAFATLSRQMFRLSTADIFAGMTRSLGIVNSMFVDANGQLTYLGRLITTVGDQIGTRIGGAMERVAQAMADVAANTQTLLRDLTDSSLVATLDRMITAGASIGEAGMRGAGIISGGQQLGPDGASARGFSFLEQLEPTAQMLATFGSMVSSTTSLLIATAQAYGALYNFLAGIVVGIMPGLTEGLAALWNGAAVLLTQFMNIVGFVIDGLAPGFNMLATGIGSLFQGIMSILIPVIVVLGTALLTAVDVVLQYLTPVLNFLVSVIGAVINALGQLLSWIGTTISAGVDEMLQSAPALGNDTASPTHHLREMLQGLSASLEGVAEGAGGAGTAGAADAAAATAARPTPGGRGGGGVHQDFRNSRFEIQQKFEEGFDPDRIAVAFANDLGRVGERRLQSGFEPLFGVR